LGKNLKTLSPCNSQSPSPADFNPPCGFLGLEISTATAESGCLGFVYIISLLPFKSCIFLSLIPLYLYLKTSSLIETIIEMHQKKENLTENHTPL
jgi:hypothetical protein